MNRAALHSVGLFLGSCAGVSDPPLPSDLVKDEEAAIQIGKHKCGAHDDSGRWYAVLHDGTWAVWLGTPVPKGRCPYLSTEIKASDGSAKECTLCVLGADESSP